MPAERAADDPKATPPKRRLAELRRRLAALRQKPEDQEPGEEQTDDEDEPQDDKKTRTAKAWPRDLNAETRSPDWGADPVEPTRE